MNTSEPHEIMSPSLGSNLRADAGNDGRSRMVVAVMEGPPQAALAARLAEVARLQMRDVLLFGLASSTNEEGRLRREIIPLAELVREAGVRVELMVSSGTSGLATLRALVRGDDVLALAPSDTPARGGRDAIDALVSIASGPIHIFSSSLPRPERRVSIRGSVLPWLISGLLILGFGWLDVRISGILTGNILTILTIALLVPEIGLIWLANALLA